MPEGDTVLRTARRLHAALAGRVLTRSELRWGERDGTPLQNHETLDVVARGKHILHRVEGGLTLHSHLRMEGSWRVVATPEAPIPGREGHLVRAVLGTTEWTALGNRLGMLDLVRTADEHRLVGHLGPDILGDDWNTELAVANVAASGVPIGAALLDQRLLAGIGTLYASESLFLERLNPWAQTTDLPESTVRAVVERAHRLLHANVAHAVQSTTGARRRGETSYVHGRSGRPCRRCGTTVRVAMIGPEGQERTMFSCPTCQPGDRPTDDGARQVPLGSTPGPSKSRRGQYRGRS